MINKVILIGTVGKAPEMKYLDGGMVVAETSIVTNTNPKDKDAREWHQIKAWGKTAEALAKFVKKGVKIYVEGKLTYNTWETKEGVKVQRAEVVASMIKFL